MMQALLSFIIRYSKILTAADLFIVIWAFWFFDHPFEILLELFSRSGLPFKIFFSRSAVITIRSKFLTSRSKFYSCHSAIQVYRSKIFLAVQTWLPSVRNFSLVFQPSYQSVWNKLSAVQPFGFIRFKRLCGPFLTCSTAVRFTRLTESC